MRHVQEIDPRAVAAAIGASILGLLVHNLEEFPLSILFAWETLFPLGIAVILGIVMIHRPGRVVYLAAGAWAGLVIVVGGGSVLPLGIWPFVPAQTVSHYAAHVVYAVAQFPLLWIAWHGLRR